VFLYSALYFSKLEANLAVTYVIYFGYMSLACFALFLLCGSVGFFAAFTFIKQIYAAIKID
jgi:transmembrane 9 superfamily protein 2/4